MLGERNVNENVKCDFKLRDQLRRRACVFKIKFNPPLDRIKVTREFELILQKILSKKFLALFFKCLTYFI